MVKIQTQSGDRIYTITIVTVDGVIKTKTTSRKAGKKPFGTNITTSGEDVNITITPSGDIYFEYNGRPIEIRRPVVIGDV